MLIATPVVEVVEVVEVVVVDDEGTVATPVAEVVEVVVVDDEGIVVPVSDWPSCTTPLAPVQALWVTAPADLAW